MIASYSRGGRGRRPAAVTIAAALAAACLLATVTGGARARGRAVTAARTVWLCRPGLRPDPCTPGLSTSVYSPALKLIGSRAPRVDRRPPIDCFYVYPTVSFEPGPLANLDIQPAETEVALTQAARYSQYCDVYAPMYRQVTTPALFTLGLARAEKLGLGTPLRDVERAFADFLARYSHGRGFVLIGHSQGAILLRRLIATEIDPDPALRARLVSAILLGGDVVVRSHSTVGGDFRHIPACTRAGELHCVIAFSTFDATPPADSLFGVSFARGESILCTNPTALAGGTGLLDPIFPSAHAQATAAAEAAALSGHAGAGATATAGAPARVWNSLPGAYSARCTSGAVHVLEVRPRDGALAPAPLPTRAWGLHLLDASIALGNLVDIVGRDAAASRKRNPRSRSRAIG
ncbi:MAG: DUF3089 domain-containing protein [Solirubrobacteraceae bacterium]